jgi:predicted transcriptional regulator
MKEVKQSIKMKLSTIKTLLNCEVLSGEDKLDVEISVSLSSDMMSDVLAFAEPGALLITGLTNSQSVRTADVADASAILYIRGKRPDEGALHLAAKMNLPVLATGLGMFEVNGILYAEGLKGIC